MAIFFCIQGVNRNNWWQYFTVYKEKTGRIVGNILLYTGSKQEELVAIFYCKQGVSRKNWWQYFSVDREKAGRPGGNILLYTSYNLGSRRS